MTKGGGKSAEHRKGDKAMKEIYLIWDQQILCVYKGTTDRNTAYEEVKRLNATEKLDRYKITVLEDFASKGKETLMTTISVYDTDAKRIEDICEEYGVSTAELIEALLDVVKDEIIYLSEWL